MSLKTALRDAEAANNALNVAAEADRPAKAQSAVDAANNLNQELLAQSFVPRVLAESYIALQRANERVVAILTPVRPAYPDADMPAVRADLNVFRAAATEFRGMVAGYGVAWNSEPLLSAKERGWVGIAAISSFLLGGVTAAFGTGKDWPASTTLSLWLAFLSFALTIVWLFAYSTMRQTSVPSVPAPGTARIGPNLQYIVFGGMAFLVMGLLAAGVMRGGLLQFLTDIPSARGLITFLITIGTIAIAVILTLASVIMDAEHDPEGREVLKERLSKGKEILTVLVGVLGTIVGFYFASGPEGSSAGRMTVINVKAPPTVKAGEEFTVTALAKGGELPYSRAAISTSDKEGVKGEGSVEANGEITVKFTVPANMPEGPLPFVVGASDKSGKAGTAKSETSVTKK